MTSFLRRRVRNTGGTLIVLAMIWLLVRARERQLEPTSFATGYVMLAAILFLALYNVRKKLPFLPLGSSSTWLQWHLYVGLGSVGVFVLHAGFAWPSGILEATLASVYLATMTSGVVGLYLTRTIPAQLARVGEEVIYERVPALHRQVQMQADELVMESVGVSGATTLADFYSSRLYSFFHRPRGAGYYLRPTTALRRALMEEMQNLRRYLSEQEANAWERLFALVRRKDDLDFHSARQGLLKTWLFAHIGLSYALVALAVLHGLLALAFRGGSL